MKSGCSLFSWLNPKSCPAYSQGWIGGPFNGVCVWLISYKYNMESLTMDYMYSG